MQQGYIQSRRFLSLLFYSTKQDGHKIIVHVVNVGWLLQGGGTGINFKPISVSSYFPQDFTLGHSTRSHNFHIYWKQHLSQSSALCPLERPHLGK